jgi:hypothetical protein
MTAPDPLWRRRHVKIRMAQRHASLSGMTAYSVVSRATQLSNDIHSARSPASFMTLDHLAISVLKKAVHSSGELPIGT